METDRLLRYAALTAGISIHFRIEMESAGNEGFGGGQPTSISECQELSLEHVNKRRIMMDESVRQSESMILETGRSGDWELMLQ